MTRRIFAATDHPRIRGEHYDFDVWCWNSCGSSPHTRGALASAAAGAGAAGIIPAYAGSTCETGASPTRGLGSSPHTRGALRATSGARACGGIIPAYAGSTACSETTRPCRADHPRIRGEHFQSQVFLPQSRGSSPHTRGAPPLASAALPPMRIIPAYAGSTSSRKMTQASRAGSSPHTRGAQKSRHEKKFVPRIIPAYAGSTENLY